MPAGEGRTTPDGLMATTDKPHILIADDQRDVREALRLLLKSEGWNCSTAEGPAEALDAVRKQSLRRAP